ncbi:MAG: hypothetical protein HY275_06475 [Gemmatimonadetes bacterium]|nr:hypothetical protein [Gemmatimonadota bacterium]
MSKVVLRALVAAALFGVVPVVVNAQGASAIKGAWKVEYPRGQRMDGGGPKPVMGTGTLTIAPKGDSLEATLEVGPRPDGSASPPQRFMGVATPEGGRFVQTRTVTVNRNGDNGSVELTSIWELKAAGDVLTGVLKATANDPGLPSFESPVTGTRVK